jgi:hypothetical protein
MEARSVTQKLTNERSWEYLCQHFETEPDDVLDHLNRTRANQSIRIKDNATFSTWLNRGRREVNILCALQDNKKECVERIGKTLNKVTRFGG